MKSKPKTSCEAGNRFKVCMWGRWCSRGPPVFHQHCVFLRNLLAGWSLGRTRGGVPGPLGQQAKSPMCNNLWRSQANYLWHSGGTSLNGDLHIWEWKNLPGYLYFGRWKNQATPTYLICIKKKKKKHQQHCSLHLSFSHASLVLLVLSQPGLIGYTANTGTVVLCKVAHSQEAYVHKAVTVAD